MNRFLSLFILALILPYTMFADESEEGFITYNRKLAPGISLIQDDNTTSILYRGKIIKTYQNKEFAIELLPHSPNETPDCYNSLKRNIVSPRAKNIVGKAYLKSCLIIDTRIIRGKYILFYAPSIEGNRVSLYDIRAKKFYHFAINTALSVEPTNDGGLVFLTSNRQSPCERSVIYFKNGSTRKIYDDCRLTQSSHPLISIRSFRIISDSVRITYIPYEVRGFDIVLRTDIQESITLPLN